MAWVARLFDLIDKIFNLFEIVLMVAAACGGFYLSWMFTGALELSWLPRLGWSLLVALISAGVAWVAWILLKLFHS